MEIDCVRVRKKDGETIRKRLLEEELLHPNIKIMSRGEDLLVPLRSLPSKGIQQDLIKDFPSIKFIKENVDEISVPHHKNFLDVVKMMLPPEMTHLVPKSFDIIGQIAIIEVTEELQKHEKLLAEALLRQIHHLKSVYSKAGVVEGVFRLRQFKFLVGINDPSTIHKENYCQFALDITKVYFNPRLGTERARVASLVSPSQKVLDLFAGVGPFSIQIGRKGTMVHAIDINPDAVHFLRKNITLNKVENFVIPHEGDARIIVSSSLAGQFDIVIMNLPKSALNYLDTASLALKSCGGRIFLYHEVNERDDMSELRRAIEQNVRKTSRNKVEIVSIKKVHNIAPFRWQTCFEISVS